MTEDSQELRDLARDYAKGRLDRETYVEARTRLLDELTGFPASDDDPTRRRVEPSAPHPIRAPEVRPSPARAAPPPPAQPKRPGSAQSAARSRLFKPWLFAAGIVLLASATAAWLILLEGGTKIDSPPARARELPEPQMAEPGRVLVQSFLEQNVWTAPAIAEFLTAWDSLEEGDRHAAAGAHWFQPLSDTVREQLSEQQALLDVRVRGPLSDDYLALLDLARRLGMRVQSPEDALSPDAEVSDRGPISSEQAEPRRGPEPGEREDSIRRPLAAPSPVETVSTAPPPEPAMSHRGPLPQAETKPQQPPLSAVPAPPSERPTEPVLPVTDTDPVAAAGQRVRSRAADLQGEAAAISGQANEEAPVVTESMVQVHPAEAEPPQERDPCPALLASSRRRYCRDLLPDGQAGPLLAVLPAGEFAMGSDAASSEKPVHRVNIPHSFALSVYEVSYAQYEAFCKVTGRPCPERVWPDPTSPVVNVSWDDARAYAHWLSLQTGAPYRLPSEAEWEYAARGGKTTVYPFGDELSPTDARFQAEDPLPGRPGMVNRNAFRLYHMVGNVREWVIDSWHPSYHDAPADGSARITPSLDQRVARGGTYADGPDKLRSAAREPLPAKSKDPYTGFRVVREVSR